MRSPFVSTAPYRVIYKCMLLVKHSSLHMCGLGACVCAVFVPARILHKNSNSNSGAYAMSHQRHEHVHVHTHIHTHTAWKPVKRNSRIWNRCIPHRCASMYCACFATGDKKLLYTPRATNTQTPPRRCADAHNHHAESHFYCLCLT